jgi:hypothetical protein
MTQEAKVTLVLVPAHHSALAMGEGGQRHESSVGMLPALGYAREERVRWQKTEE